MKGSLEEGITEQNKQSEATLQMCRIIISNTQESITEE